MKETVVPESMSLPKYESEHPLTKKGIICYPIKHIQTR